MKTLFERNMMQPDMLAMHRYRPEIIKWVCEEDYAEEYINEITGDDCHVVEIHYKVKDSNNVEGDIFIDLIDRKDYIIKYYPSEENEDKQPSRIYQNDHIFDYAEDIKNEIIRVQRWVGVPGDLAEDIANRIHSYKR